jgi:hypothetical protein
MTREQIVQHEKREIQIAARVSELKRLAARTALTFRIMQEAADQIVGHPKLIDTGADIYRPLPRKAD